ncbi:[FeFe] hydrogenase H-cluster radical SAM maturase HydE [Clostridia bacterium]|nr:[FeFe] hydrogenase H-cluster radical SAM maturase HydE [Clostridia bacterium]
MKLTERLIQDGTLSREEFAELLSVYSDDDAEQLFEKARELRERVYGREVYMRGLIEFTSHCKRDCLYCGLRRSNEKAERYRLDKAQILECCQIGYGLGFRTFVLQGGEDAHYTDDYMCDIVHTIRENYPDCAVTLSMGERSRESYTRLFQAGAERYLLRHETANDHHYSKLHPEGMKLRDRIKCLYDLKEIGYQVGCGFMVGTPWQTRAHIADDLIFIKEFQPHMIGIGPFIPHKDTPLGDQAAGMLRDTVFLLAVLRVMLPGALIPATTALGTIHPQGRELGIKAGANVVMPNLSPLDVRGKYLLYDGKICTGDEAAECRHCMEGRIKSTGYELVVSRGDWKNGVLEV